METKSEVKSAKKLKKINYKPLALEIAKTVGYSILTGFCMAAGGHGYASLMRTQKAKLISINGGRHSAAS